MLFLRTVGPVMKLHYTLFKYAQLAPQGSQKSLLFQLCDLRVSVTAKILGELTELLFDGAPVTFPHLCWGHCAVGLSTSRPLPVLSFCGSLGKSGAAWSTLS